MDSEMIAIIFMVMGEEVVWGASITGILFLVILTYRKSPWRKRRVAEIRAREKKEWLMSTPDRLRETLWGP